MFTLRADVRRDEIGYLATRRVSHFSGSCCVIPPLVDEVLEASLAHVVIRVLFFDGPIEALPCPSHERVEGLAVRALGPLLELRVNVHRHLRVGVPVLAHHPEDVEAVASRATEM